MADLISRAALLDAIFGCFNVMESKGIDMTVARTIVKGVLDEAPTIDAIPVEWLEDKMQNSPKELGIAAWRVLNAWRQMVDQEVL